MKSANAAIELNTINIDAVLRRAVEKKQVSGVVAAAANRDGVVYAKAFGKTDVANNVDMNVASIFRIASMTKAVTSVAVMQLLETGKVSLDGAVAEYLPELAEVRVLDGFEATTGNPRLRAPARPITIRQLLAHTSGFSYEMWNEDIVAYSREDNNSLRLLSSAILETAGSMASARTGSAGWLSA
jgi:CubicO group peptidase (beta-lactamase class C family)